MLRVRSKAASWVTSKQIGERRMKNKMNRVIKLIGDLGERFYYPIMAVAVVFLFAAVATSVS